MMPCFVCGKPGRSLVTPVGKTLLDCIGVVCNEFCGKRLPRIAERARPKWRKQIARLGKLLAHEAWKAA